MGSQQDGTLFSTYEGLKKIASTSRSDSAYRELAATYDTIVGNYNEARDAYVSLQEATLAAFSPTAMASSALAKTATELARFTSEKKLVLFNEAHLIAGSRRITLEMLPELREQGFTYLALEGLEATDVNISNRGYATSGSGIYLQEPVYGELIRTAAELGFKIVPYEASVESGGFQERREAEQASNIEAIFKKDPNAKVIVNAGHGHIYKAGLIEGVPAMAARLVAAFGENQVFSIDQTWMFDSGTNIASDQYRRAIAKWPHGTPFILVSQLGEVYSADKARYDATVFFPPSRTVLKRPEWLDLNGLRSPHVVSAGECANTFPCLVEAHYVGESSVAVAADRYIFNSALEETFLFTRRKPFEITVTNAAGVHIVATQSLLLPYESASSK